MQTLDEKAKAAFLAMCEQEAGLCGASVFTDVDEELERSREILREVQAGQERWWPALRTAPTEVQVALSVIPRHVALLERRVRELADNPLAQRMLRGGHR